MLRNPTNYLTHPPFAKSAKDGAPHLLRAEMRGQRPTQANRGLEWATRIIPGIEE